MPEFLFARARILEAFQALSDELGRMGVHGEFFVVGGAAIALTYDTRRITRDVDAAFEPKAQVREAARRVAEWLELPDDWINDAAKSFMPGSDPSAQPVLSLENVEVAVGSPRYLLAMKLLATRIGEDDQDIRLLLRASGIKSVDEALGLVTAYYPVAIIPPKTRFFLEEILNSAGPGTGLAEGQDTRP